MNNCSGPDACIDRKYDPNDPICKDCEPDRGEFEPEWLVNTSYCRCGQCYYCVTYNKIT